MRIIVNEQCSLESLEQGLVKIIHELWKSFHELCSPESLKRGLFVKNSRTRALFLNNLPNRFWKNPKKGFVREQFVNKGLVLKRFAKPVLEQYLQNIKIDFFILSILG